MDTDADDPASPFETIGRHDDDVTAVTFDTDGDRLYAASADGTVSVWATEGEGTSEHTDTLEGHDSAVDAVAVTPAGTVLTGGREGSVRLWTPAGDIAGTLDADIDTEGAVTVVAVAPVGDIVAAGTGTGDVYLWSAPEDDPEPVARLDHGEPVRTVAFGPGGDELLSAGVGELARVWSVSDGDARYDLPGHGRGATGAAYDDEGRAVTVSETGKARIWVTDRVESGFEVGRSGRYPVATAPDTVAVGVDGGVSSFDRMGEPLAELDVSADVLTVAFDADGDRLVVGGDDGRLRVHHIE
jgi:hypothetical protein